MTIRNAPAAPWLHLVWAMAFIVLVEAAVTSGESASLHSAAGLAGFLYTVLPIAAAVSVAFVPIDARFRRRVLVLGLTATASMLVLDLAAPTAPVQTGQRVAVLDGRTVSDPIFSDLTRASGVRVLVGAATGRVRGSEERLAEYSVDHPRLAVARALMKTGLMGLPIILVVALGWSLLWIRREIPRPESARTASFVVGWCAGPAIYLLTYQLSYRAYVSAIVGDGALQTILAPYIPLAGIGWVLWQAAGRDITYPALQSLSR